MKVYRLNTQESASKGATHLAKLTAADLTTTATGAGTFDILSVRAGSLAEVIGTRIVTPFQDSNDASNNSTVITAGMPGSASNLMAATAVNAHATRNNPTVGAGRGAYSNDGSIQITVTPGSGKTLAALDTGELNIWLRVTDLNSPS